MNRPMSDQWCSPMIKNRKPKPAPVDIKLVGGPYDGSKLTVWQYPYDYVSAVFTAKGMTGRYKGVGYRKEAEWINDK